MEEVKTEKENVKYLGGLKTLDTSIGMGQMNNFEMNNLALLTGMNGSGKTMVLVQTWIVNYITNSYLVAKTSMEDTTKGLQILFDKSFDQNDFTGKVHGEFEHIHIDFDIDNGKVQNLIFTCISCDTKDIIPNGMPIFMSTNTRLFTSLNQYIKFKKAIGITNPVEKLSECDFMKLCDSYKIYDVLFMEQQLKRLSDPYFKMQSPTTVALKDAFKKDISHIFYDEKKGEIQVTELRDGKPETYPVTRLSNGEQAMLNMLIQY
jgi:hypothetical protein